MVKKLLELVAPAKIWKQILELTINEQLKLYCDKKGLHHRSVDPAHVCMVKTDISKNIFTRYDLKKPIELGLDPESFIDRLKKVKIHEHVILRYYDDNMLQIKIEKPYGPLYKKLFTIDTAAISEPKMPALNLNFIEVNREYFIDAFLNISDISDHIKMTFKIKEEKLRIEAYTDELENRTELPIKKIDVKKKTNQVSLFSVDYMEMHLIRMLKKSNSDLIIGIGHDNPLSVEFGQIDNKKRKLFNTVFLLAPRIESE